MSKLKINTNNIFYVLYVLLLLENMFSTVVVLSDILKYFGYILLVGVVFYVIFINRKAKKEELFKILIYFIVVTITAFVSSNKQLLKIMLLMMAFKEIDFDDFCKKDFKYRLLFLISIIILSFVGLTNGNDVFRENEIRRYSLGFYHPNILGLHTLTLCLEYLYINRNKERVKQFVVVIITLLFNAFVTDSRACIVSLLLAFVYLCFPKKNLAKIYDSALCKTTVKNIYLIFMIIMLILSFSFKLDGNNFINKIDNMLSTRIYCANYYVKNYNLLKPFGQFIERLDDSIVGNFLPLDIGYIHLLVIYGPIMMALLLYMFYTIFKRSYKNKNYMLISIFVIWSVYSVIETNSLVDIYNPFLITLAVVFYDHINGIDEEKKKEDEKEENFLKKIYHKILLYLPKSIAHKIFYYSQTKKHLNLKNPKDFNEKIQYLMVYKYRKKYGMLADKYLVRDYVKTKGYESLLPKLYGIFNNAEEIDVDNLPNEFVLKTNHGSGGVFICTDKNNFDIDNAKEILNKMLKKSFASECLEYHYNYIQPKIICEEYLKEKNHQNPTDYKFYCYDGHVECMLLCTERETGLKLDYYDLNWNYLEYAKKEFRSNKKHKKPKNYQKMIEIASDLSKGFAFVRVDFYEINGQIYFGELTFTPYAGVVNYNSQEALDYLGSLINIEHVEKE